MPTILKTIGPPGSWSFLGVCVVIGLALIYVWPRNRRLGRAWLLGVVALYAVLSLPSVANPMASWLSSAPAPAPAHSQAIDALIVLDGDNRQGRVHATVWTYRSASPSVVWVLGDDWLVEALIEVGIPRDRIAHDPGPRTTRDQIVRVRQLHRERLTDRLAVIASRLQMPRVAALARASGLEVSLISSPADTEPAQRGVWRFVPSRAALSVSRDAIYEHVALAYYRWRRWI